MFKNNKTFTSFSVHDREIVKDFYVDKLGLELVQDKMGHTLRLGGGGEVFIYGKENHQPASYTVLNFVVDDIDKAADELAQKGIELEIYEGFHQDERGIAHSTAPEDGPSIAWFKDPSGNVLSILEGDRS